MGKDTEQKTSENDLVGAQHVNITAGSSVHWDINQRES